MSDVPHHGHRVSEWTVEPVGGYPRNAGWCWDCSESFDVRLRWSS